MRTRHVQIAAATLAALAAVTVPVAPALAADGGLLMVGTSSSTQFGTATSIW